MKTMLCKTVLVAAALASPVFAADAITASGMLTPLEEVQVGSELRGLIVWMAEEGAYVKKGEPLVKLRDNLERLDVELRKAQLDSARYAVERYKKDYEAYKKLHQEKIANDEQLREKELNYLVSKAQVEQYEANLKSAIETVDMKVIRAPTNCVVTRHFKKPGEVLVITAGVENILKVVHLDSIYMVAFPDAKYAHQVKVGQKAQVNIPLYGDRKLSGEVVFVDPVVDAASGGFRIKVLIPNEKHDIKAGLHGTVTLTPETSHAASK